MNALVNFCLLSIVLYNALGAPGSETTRAGDLSGMTAGPASGEDLHRSLSADNETEADEELSGGSIGVFTLHELHPSKEERRRRKGHGKKKNKKNKGTTPSNPGHTMITNRYTSTFSTTEDPCTSTHLGYCIHGYCKNIEGLKEPVCICMKGYDGERCGIQILFSGNPAPDHSYDKELMETVLVVIAVVLSVISCCAILLMTCAHYRSHKNFMASYLGTGSEQEKLQKPISDVVV